MKANHDESGPEDWDEFYGGYDPDEATDLCADCGKAIADEDTCGVCGRAMCFACFEMGAGVCGRPHAV